MTTPQSAKICIAFAQNGSQAKAYHVRQIRNIVLKDRLAGESDEE